MTGVPRTDLGNALRLVKEYCKKIRYCAPWGKWLYWDGMRWKTDETGEVVRMAKNVVLGLISKAKKQQSPDTQQAAVRHAMRSQNAARISAMISLAQTEPGVPVTPSSLDRDPYLLNCLNGTVKPSLWPPVAASPRGSNNEARAGQL
jgi:putative DNA primase/helicase